METIKPITKKDIGIVIDESAGSADGLNNRTIKLAMSHGFKLDDDGEAILQKYAESEMGGEDYDSLSEMAYEAIDYLNGLELPAYCSFYFEDNSVFLLPSIEVAKESVEFVSSRKRDYPADEFRGEWLHISDHGNATLYVRNEQGRDVEQWAIV